MPTDTPPIIVVSNRGPIAFKIDDDGNAVPTRAGGGLVASLAPALHNIGATWIAAEVTESDDTPPTPPVELDGIVVRHLAIEATRYRQYYDVIANGTLWFMHHNIFDLPRRPLIDKHWWEAWNTYREVNYAFAQEVANVAPVGAVVLVHDYHLTLLGKWLREHRPDLKTIHFHHTPFAGKNSVRVLPQSVSDELLAGLAGHDACGFHAQRWADSYLEACRDNSTPATSVFVSPAGIDLSELELIAGSQNCKDALALIERGIGERKLIVRVDRVELSKNILRGFFAYEGLLERFPQWRERVTFAAFVYPSREGLSDYLAYRNEVEGVVQRINDRFGTENWMPIELFMGDDFPASVAALRRYDVLLINPIRDGLNLVAKEGAVLNERDGAIVLSREAGSWQELSEGAVEINPFDIVGTTDALVAALEMEATERARRAELLRAAAKANSPHDWLSDQLAAAGIYAN